MGVDDILYAVYLKNYAEFSSVDVFGLSTFRSVDVSVCRRFGLSTFWFVDVLVCRRFGLSTFWFVDVSVCRRFGCRRFGLSTFWLVTVLCTTCDLYASLERPLYLKDMIGRHKKSHIKEAERMQSHRHRCSRVAMVAEWRHCGHHSRRSIHAIGGAEVAQRKHKEEGSPRLRDWASQQNALIT